MKKILQLTFILLLAIFGISISFAQSLDELLKQGDQYVAEFQNQKALDIYLKADESTYYYFSYIRKTDMKTSIAILTCFLFIVCCQNKNENTELKKCKQEPIIQNLEQLLKTNFANESKSFTDPITNKSVETMNKIKFRR